MQNLPLNFTLNQGSCRSAVSFRISASGKFDGRRANDAAKVGRSGLLTRDEMHTNCCYATQDKTWARDPDGNQWEVFVVLEDNLPETAAAADCCGTDGTRATPLTQIA